MKLTMTGRIISASLVLTLSACGGQFSSPLAGIMKTPHTQEAQLDEPVAEPSVVAAGGGGRSADALDNTTEAEKQAAKAAPAGGAVLGTTVASLGDPTEQGFWLRTPLVNVETQGSVETESGAVVRVKLIPINGPPSAGSRISLAAMRALNLGLTDLATLTVSKG
jgi:hypothetical protein